MFLAKVVGTVWSTKKSPDLEGVRFLVVHPYDLDKEPTRNIVVVADRFGSRNGRDGDVRLRKAARTAIGSQGMSIEAAVVGIVDRVDLQSQYPKRCATLPENWHTITADPKTF